MKDNKQFVTIATVDQLPQAELMRCLLEDAGISCYIKDAYMGSFISTAVGGIKVEVEREDVENAKKVLASTDTTHSTEEEITQHD